MAKQLKISIGQYSDKGCKEINQDFYGVYIPKEPLLSSKGIAIALADGISSSDVSQVASQTAVTSFLQDYFCTSEAWTVKKSAQCVLDATNSWLYSQTHNSPYRFDKDRGYVCTLSTLILKSTTAYIFHAGDTRIYQLRDNTLEQLTEDHRHWISDEKSYLSRALGVQQQLELDAQTLQLQENDIFILATDGVYEFVDEPFIIDSINKDKDDLEAAAKNIIDNAYQHDSDDNLTIQIIKIDELPTQDVDELYQQLTRLPFPPLLEARTLFDGYTIISEEHASNRSHVYLAVDNESKERVIIKIPSIEQRSDPAYLERFLLEEWIARRISSPYVLKPCKQTRKQNFLYITTEYIEGQTLIQWMIDNPKPSIETVRGIVEQIAKGLMAFHRLEMLHQDLRPNNIMIDKNGTVKIIDFGSTRVGSLMEIASPIEHQHIQGTAQYTATEYFLGEAGTPRSDLFSLGVMTYQMLTGRLPYGLKVPAARTKAAQNKLNYISALDDEREIPAWVDDAIKKAVHPNPLKRYEELSEFVYDLRHPNKSFINKTRAPLMERNPVAFWQGVSLILTGIIIMLLYKG